MLVVWRESRPSTNVARSGRTRAHAGTRRWPATCKRVASILAGTIILSRTSVVTNETSLHVGTADDSSPWRLTTATSGPIVREDLRGPFLDGARHVAKREARIASVAPRRHGHAHDLGFVAWIHPLNLASAVLAFRSQAVGRAGHHVAEFSRSPRRPQGSRFARPAPAGCGLDDDLARAHAWLLRDGLLNAFSERETWQCARQNFLAD
jgi:hypothetical protein